MTFRFSWQGRAVGVNQRSTIRRAGRHGNPFIARSSPYRSFTNHLTTHILSLHPPRHLPPPLSVHITHASAHDIDALIKPILDSLEAAGVIQNDRLITSLLVSKHPAKRGHTSLQVSVTSGS